MINPFPSFTARPATGVIPTAVPTNVGALSTVRSPSGMLGGIVAPNFGPPLQMPNTTVGPRQTPAPTTEAPNPQQGNVENLVRWVEKHLQDKFNVLGVKVNVLDVLFPPAIAAEVLSQYGASAASGLRTNGVAGLDYLGAHLLGGSAGNAGDQLANALSTPGETSESVSTQGVKVQVGGVGVSISNPF